MDELIKKLSEPPTKKINELPVKTNTLTLPFHKLKWEDFEKFCFQLGCSYMNCLDTSYIYGRPGQKQEGIDIYFNNDGNINVWQINLVGLCSEANSGMISSITLDKKSITLLSIISSPSPSPN